MTTTYDSFGIASSKMISSAGETVNIWDSCTRGYKITDSARSNVCEGRKFFAETSITISAGGTGYVLGITPSSPLILMDARIVQVKSSATIDITVSLLESVTCETATGNVTALCMNRNMTAGGSFIINNAPATVSGGTTIPPTSYLTTATKDTSAGGLSDFMYQMKSSTKYAISTVNAGGAAATVSFFWTWTEVT